uniref:Uncharacterized protein n=1 Tax=Acrobeloides nanus TaxID=290746 RepID=A0A914C186_9BILA
MSLREFPTDEDFFKFEKEWTEGVSYHEEYCEEVYEEENKSCEINDRLDTASTKEDLENSYKEERKPTNSSVLSSNNGQSIQNLKMMIYSTLGIRGYEGIYASSLAREFQLF